MLGCSQDILFRATPVTKGAAAPLHQWPGTWLLCCCLLPNKVSTMAESHRQSRLKTWSFWLIHNAKLHSYSQPRKVEKNSDNDTLCDIAKCALSCDISTALPALTLLAEHCHVNNSSHALLHRLTCIISWWHGRQQGVYRYTISKINARPYFSCFTLWTHVHCRSTPFVAFIATMAICSAPRVKHNALPLFALWE